jgi:hypothetical protein
MYTESGDNEEKEDADVAERTDELQKLDGPAQKIVRCRIRRLHYGVIKHHAQRGDAAQRIDALQTTIE